jgi:hypothetical protein
MQLTGGGGGTASISNTEIAERYQAALLRMIVDARGTCRILLREGISKRNQLQKKSVITAPIQCAPQSTPKRPSSEPHGATRQQAIAKTPAKRSAYQIPSVAFSPQANYTD